ncbi:2-dehydro-3-deoxygluconokinase [Tamaricihabitans halophyticus]|uniref:2-dehydro-3-deoxygluconokinase n=1 Tax=Tamaricihabitans halophyticus TaxID=1262583 RepID=A0A4R2R124_9PSEU|nr:sugar kinase [Tamaricihabitans halophyticus]TCP56370.1 2-dehydro-3-deoxygluconokinase [Tamaricihabitans halophyticus]
MSRPSTRPALVTLGETMAVLACPEVGLLRQQRGLDLRVAGAESTVAIGAARLGLPSAWLGRVGADEFGELIRQTLAGAGVDVSGVGTDATAPTGLMIKERRTAEVTRVSYRRAGSAGSQLCQEDVDPELVAGAAVLHVSGITPALSESAREAVRAAVRMANHAGVPVAVDINHRETLWSAAHAVADYRWLVEHAQIVFATETEAGLLVDDADTMDSSGLARALGELGPGEVLLKRGARGATACVAGETYEAPRYQVRALDPVGAGDGFAAGYLAERVRGGSIADRLRIAAAVGAFAVTVAGDWEGLPTRAELDLLTSPDVAR